MRLFLYIATFLPVFLLGACTTAPREQSGWLRPEIEEALQGHPALRGVEGACRFGSTTTQRDMAFKGSDGTYIGDRTLSSELRTTCHSPTRQISEIGRAHV